MTLQDKDLTQINPRWNLFANSELLSAQATQDILDAARCAIQEKGAFHIVLAGGTTPKYVYQQLALAKSDWQHWHIYIGDERCLSVDNTDRNSVMAAEYLLDRVTIPKSQIHFIPAELGPVKAAAAYQETLSTVEEFDMVLLGIGEDGHTASLFPNHNNEPSQTVHPVFNSPKPPAERVSLSSATLSNNAHLLIFITGQSKHDRIIDWISGVSMPITSIKSNKRAVVYCDHAAWLGYN